ncbi:MAG: hypothetical protein JW810_06265 [Sedimentisphaerales bacterium]|nr:hypothetical protein [Sedimentisphaerales bacterium]
MRNRQFHLRYRVGPLAAVLLAAVFLTAGTAAARAADPAMAASSPGEAECHVRGGLANVFGSLQGGAAVRIAYLGGSITAQDGWRPKTLEWFRRQYPQAKVSQINAAIGGTGSDLGVFRLEHDVLRYHPDLLFVEFAVNDGGAAPERIHKAMEGIVRQTWQADPNTDICFVYTLTENMLPELQEGKYPRAAAAMEELAEHYRIPSIHMGWQVARLVQQGKVIFRAPRPPEGQNDPPAGAIPFSPDGVHPYPDTGHELYREAAVRSMERIRTAGTPGPHVLTAPLRPDHWQAAKMIPLSRAELSTGWRKLNSAEHPLAKRFSGRLPEMYLANEPGQTIRLRFRGTHLKIYDLVGPDCGQVVVQLDDEEPRIRPRFDAYCTYHRLATLPVAEGLSDGIHTVSLEIHPDQPDKAEILSRRKENIDDPARFDDTAWYAGAILVIGDLVE